MDNINFQPFKKNLVDADSSKNKSANSTPKKDQNDYYDNSNIAGVIEVRSLGNVNNITGKLYLKKFDLDKQVILPGYNYKKIDELLSTINESSYLNNLFSYLNNINDQINLQFFIDTLIREEDQYDNISFDLVVDKGLLQMKNMKIFNNAGSPVLFAGFSIISDLISLPKIEILINKIMLNNSYSEYFLSLMNFDKILPLDTINISLKVDIDNIEVKKNSDINLKSGNSIKDDNNISIKDLYFEANNNKNSLYISKGIMKIFDGNVAFSSNIFLSSNEIELLIDVNDINMNFFKNDLNNILNNNSNLNLKGVIKTSGRDLDNIFYNMSFEGNAFISSLNIPFFDVDDFIKEVREDNYNIVNIDNDLDNILKRRKGFLTMPSLILIFFQRVNYWLQILLSTAISPI
ncbi:MAG TPA: hypothetical protein QKA14_00165 [Candidatus Megaira endosymbiont of Hartmannula sinica]|nr:hypothetical protein [Candidatus Megaera endosymbiont of Hartmannula sinica]